LCTDRYCDAPPFYQGLGYTPATVAGTMKITAGIADSGSTNNIAGTGLNTKYIFTGTTKHDFANPAKWTANTADAAGTIPATIGNATVTPVTPVAQGKHLNMPCCNYSDHHTGRFGDFTESANSSDDLQIAVYPNPANTLVSFQFSAIIDATIKLMDITGQVIQEISVSNSSIKALNIASYTPGIYLYQVTTKSKTQTGKIVIE
jgi:hypothetical protein